MQGDFFIIFFIFESHGWSFDSRLFGDCITSIKLLTDLLDLSSDGLEQVFGKPLQSITRQAVLSTTNTQGVVSQDLASAVKPASPLPHARLCHLFVVSVKPFVKLCCKQDH